MTQTTTSQTCDYLIIGAGIMGLAIARELRQRQPQARIIILEKESRLGRHASGRNSGVLHSGIYYHRDSLKAKLCATGARMMAAYCDEHGLPINRIGKVIVPVRASDDPQLQTLCERARCNQARAEIIDAQQLKALEPAAYSITGKALYAPDSAVVDAKSVLWHLAENLQEQGIELRLNSLVESIHVPSKSLTVNGETIHYGHLFNAAGMYADTIAKQFGLSEHYTILPFKGIYYRVNPLAKVDIKRLIYPVPHMDVPFLGVHFTRCVDDSVYVGPTAIPALGRENYAGLTGMKLTEAGKVLYHLAKHYLKNRQGFRNFAHAEALRFVKAKFVAAAKALVPSIEAKDLLPSAKVGIRAQLLDLANEQLVMDFLVEHKENSTHVLNAVSPGFTSAFAIADHLVNELKL